jgi:hypothetical protein
MPMQVIDNFFPDDMFKKLQEKILGPTMPFCYIPNISTPVWMQVEDPLAKETDAFCLAMYDKQNKIVSDEYLLLKPYFMHMLHKLGYNEHNLTRVRCVTTLSVPGMTSEYYNLPHVDHPGEHKSAVFYVNDSDGDTRIFHQRQEPFGWRLGQDPTEEDKKKYASQFTLSGFTVKHSISPKANRLLIFDGLQYHAAGFPLDSRRRVILNMNISEKMEKVYD